MAQGSYCIFCTWILVSGDYWKCSESVGDTDLFAPIFPNPNKKIRACTHAARSYWQLRTPLYLM